jgi:hypothetical protein
MNEKSRYMGGVGRPLIEVPAPEQADAVPENVTPLHSPAEPELSASVEYLRSKKRLREQS